MKATIEYCVPCHYDGKAKELAKKFHDAGIYSETIPSGQGDRVGCFEVVVDGKLIHSKLNSSGKGQNLESYNWPNFDDLVAQVK